MKTLKTLIGILCVIGIPALAAAGPYPYEEDAIQGIIDSEVNPIFVGWATSVVDYSPAPDVDAGWQTPEEALGPVTGNNGDIVSLGDLGQTQIDAWLSDPVANPGPGQITLGFDQAITDGGGYDFAVFENGFYQSGSGPENLFAELAYVEVSTDGVNFARFANDSLTSAPVGNYGVVDQTDIYNLAGKHPLGYGTGFDLSELSTDTLVTSGLVDLNDINYVRLIDIPGSGDFTDSDGDPIYDAWVTWGSGGLDLEAVGVIHAVPIPGAVFLMFSGIVSVLGIRRFSKQHSE